MTTTDTPKTPREFAEAMIRSTIEADRLADENINDRRLREAHTHSAVNGLIATMAMEMLRRHNPTIAAEVAQQLERILTAGDLAGPAYRTARALGHDPDQWITEFEERAARRKAKDQ